MTIRPEIFLLWVLAGLVTWLVRVVPFAFVRELKLPRWLHRFLAYLPICILTALLCQSVLIVSPLETAPQFAWRESFALVPTILVALRTKNLIVTVLVGVVCVALLRFWFG